MKRKKEKPRKEEFDWSKVREEPFIIAVILFTEVICALSQVIVGLLFDDICSVLFRRVRKKNRTK